MRQLIVLAAAAGLLLFEAGCASDGGSPATYVDGGGGSGGSGGGGGNGGGAPAGGSGGGGGAPVGGGGGGAPDCPDRDGDGFQDIACNVNIMFNGGDCNDQNNTVYPGRMENCGDRADNNCDGRADEGCESCADADADGYQDAACNNSANAQPPGGDCNDQDPSINPGVMERCGNGKDDDCSQGDLQCRQNCTDNDSDGFGEGSGCLATDCDDTNATINPWATEICGNGRDEDCVGGDLPCPADCQDADKDGFGIGGGCFGNDCNDADAKINPGAWDVPGDGVDQDCAGGDTTLRDNCQDNDHDGFGEGAGCAGADCNDSDPRINSGRVEVCGNGRDDDCAGGDQGCSGGMGEGECMDMDGDGFGPGRCLRGTNDCDDGNNMIHPDAPEICDGVDNNCNNRIDECPQQAQVCENGSCRGRAGAPCQGDGDCSQALALACNPDVHECRVADGEVCVDGSDCNPGAECILLAVCDDQDRRCYQAKSGPCEESCDCTGDFLCHPANNRCIECLGGGCDRDARDTCADGGYCVEVGIVGGAGEDAMAQMLRLLTRCWGSWAQDNEIQGCFQVLTDAPFESGGMPLNALGDDEALVDFVCGDGPAGIGFSGDEIDILHELFGCGLFDVFNIVWDFQLRPGDDTYCVYYVPQKSGFGFPDDTRAAVVFDRCSRSFFD